jgi:hypothetical protein
MVPSQTGKNAEKAAAAAVVSHPVLSLGVTRFMELEREVEQAYGPLLLKALEEKVQAERARIESQAPQCVRCSQAMKYHDRPKVSWIVRFGTLRALSLRVSAIARSSGSRTGADQRVAGTPAGVADGDCAL